ncbi:hypothetical protein Tsubulata_020824 [Turnera subulata]|uniref:Cytochrome c oxidase assembly factor 3 mitochondrial coiled-coil domain-containing protein n=1 Tax=Turnera subulata TaxID=218843 RepID=A0A9Q0G645_9ROSI|nr:hypothetical protein Tsubulata_020824 [Turnera subulata]
MQNKLKSNGQQKLAIPRGLRVIGWEHSGKKMAGLLGFSNLAPKSKNLVVAGGLSAFVFGVYFYTMRAVGGTDELQIAIDKFEEQKSKQEAGSKA